MRSRHRVAKHSGFSELPCRDYNQPLADRAMILNRNFLYRMILSSAFNIHNFKAVGLNPNLATKQWLVIRFDINSFCCRRQIDFINNSALPRAKGF